MSIEFICEAGVNHNGDLTLARKLADTANELKVGTVKFQTYKVEKLLRPDDPNWGTLEKLALSQAAFKELSKHCADIGIEFMTTPGDVDSLKFAVEELGVKRIKIGSDDLTNYKLLAAARDTKLPIILSTGMASMSEVYDGILGCSAAPFPNVTVLHCVSLYPTQLRDANIGAIPHMRERLSSWRIPVGYSDHTGNVIACMTAAAVGACMIEAHLMLLEGAPPIDQDVSYPPQKFRFMMEKVQMVEAALGHGRKEPNRHELMSISKFRKGVDGLRGIV